MSSFDEVERRSKLIIPKSVNDGKVVKLKLKELKTQKEVRTVLPEEKYVEGLEKIIVKDFFPELPKLKAQSEYIEAMSRNDVAKMRELQLRFSTSRRTDRRTSPIGGRLRTSPIKRSDGNGSPSVFDPETPGPSQLGSERANSPAWNEQEGDNEALMDKKKKKAKKSALEGLSVDAYLNKFTSEDNASFEELTDLMDQREKIRNHWIYSNAERHNRELITRGAPMIENADMQLALKYDPEIQKEKPRELDNWTYTARNTVLFHPTGAAFTKEEMIERAAQNQRVINREATRFPEDLKNKPTEASMARAAFIQAQVQAGKVDVSGREAGVSNAALGILATPSPMPGIDDSPLMTWGEIDGTPFRLDASDLDPQLMGAPAFKIPDLPTRDVLAKSISDTIAQRYHDKRKNAMEQAERAHKTPKFGSSRHSDKLMKMSPAARALASNKLGIRLGSSEKLRKSFTPSPSPSRTPTSTPKSSVRHSISSSIRRKETPLRSSLDTGSITDNLLKIGETFSDVAGTQSTPEAHASDSQETQRARAKFWFYMSLHEAPYGEIPAGSRLHQYLGGGNSNRGNGHFQLPSQGSGASMQGLNVDVPAFVPRFAQMNLGAGENVDRNHSRSPFSQQRPFSSVISHEPSDTYGGPNQSSYYYGGPGEELEPDAEGGAQAMIQTNGVFQYNGPVPHIGKFRPRGATGGNNMTQFLAPELKLELLDRQLAIECKADPNIYPDLPQQIEHMRDLVPLERLPQPPFPPNQVSTVYKAVSVRDGTPYAIRRIHNFRPPNATGKPLHAAENWRKLVHVNIVQLREVVQTRGFGDNSLIFVSDYHPKALSLKQRHFAGAGGFLDSMNGARIGHHHPPAGIIVESLLWNYIVQLSSALRAIHASGLAARCLSLEKVLIHGKYKVLLSSCGVQDVLNPEGQTIQQLQNEDLVALGRLILCLATGKANLVGQNANQSLTYVAQHYSSDMRNLVNFLLSVGQAGAPRRSINEVMPMIGARFYAQLESAQLRNDILENELSKELENGRLFRLLCKLNTIIERPEAEMGQWSETGDRFLLKLFRDYIFHQVTDTGKPWMDMAHVVHTLNKLDAGVSEKIALVSRDSENVLIVSYADLKNCVQQAFNELTSASGRN
ncbi:unnamed protein product, partial [Mesorhabditis belari]|uniref:PAN2-PAN3 deadenylation complex subunit PAN3 n=1 Tax=Mesorhabditis belari TaxID=2138241 RepID=A0AAF3EA09_9BILA